MPPAPIQLSDIKDRLVGLDQWFEAAARSKSSYDDAKITSLIPSWVRKFERETTFRVSPVQIVSAPDGTYNVGTPGAGTVSSVGNKVTGVGTAFDTFFQPGQFISVGTVSVPILSVEDATHLTLERPGPPWSGASYHLLPLPIVLESGYPFYAANADEFFVTTFRERPVQSVQRFRLMYNGQQLIYTIPESWFSLDGRSGRFWLLPFYGQAAVVGMQTGLAALSTFNYDYIPNLLFYDYQAGLPDGWQYSHEWSDIHLVLSEFCALQVLGDIANCISAGQTSKQLSGVGINQSTSFDRFKDRKKELQDSTDAFKSLWKDSETAVMMGAI